MINKKLILARRFFARHFQFLARIYIRLKLSRLDFSRNEPIIVLTVGKVGSSSVYNSLKRQLDRPVFHLHRFTPKTISMAKQQHLDSARNSLPMHLILAEELLNKMNHSAPCNIQVITLIREPIAQCISAFFQNTDKYGREIEGRDITINEARTLQRLKEIFSQHDISDNVLSWLDTEIKEHFGIDVFKEEFPHKKGYQIYDNQKGNARLLLMRLEDLSDVFTQATKDFFDDDKGYKLFSSNIGTSKIYKDAYINVKNTITLPEAAVQKIIDSKFVRHFYPDKIEAIKERWLG